jgi:hypothetical protein
MRPAAEALLIVGGLVRIWLWFVIYGDWGWPEWFHGPGWPR